MAMSETVKMDAVMMTLVVMCSSLIPLVLGACGYEACNKEIPGMLNVHLVPHTHNDPGWLVTVDQYYYRKVQFILDGVIRMLEEDPSKRFTYVEMAFFSRWWREKDEGMKRRVRDLVNQGRLEFTLGGWVMNDEAATHYAAIIDQHKLGFEFLRENFGHCGRTKVGWQIDPFGHSREQASIFAQFGFDGLFFGRLDEQDKDNRKRTKTMEFVWHGSPNNLGASSDLFTGVLPYGYDWPRGFHFDVWDVYQPDSQQKFIHDDPELQDYNVNGMVDTFIKSMKQYQSWYNTSHVIATMGSDFDYVSAILDFTEIDKLIKHVNARQPQGSKVNLLYSTPSCYLKSVHGDGRVWSTKSDDFFPYATKPHTYWTGYYTSRPAQKFYTRQMNQFLQGVKQLSALAKLDNSHGKLDDVQKLAESVSLGQHHDAITGTERQIVAFDYAQRIAKGQAAAQNVVRSAYIILFNKTGGTRTARQEFCDYRNVSVCTTTMNNKRFEVTMYNPLTWTVSYTARIPVSGSAYIVLADDGKTEVSNDVLQVPSAPSGIRPKGMKAATKELVFTANLPPLGFATYFVEQQEEKSPKSRPNSGVIQSRQSNVLSGKFVEVHFDSSGHVTKLVNKASSVSSPFRQNFYYYKPHLSENGSQASGAYIFRPSDSTPIPIQLTKLDGFFKGSEVQQIHQRFSEWLGQVIRVYRDKPFVEFEWTIGPIPYEGTDGKEVITRYHLDGWGNNDVFYTDSNGREILKRKLNYRPTWKVNITEPVAGNYFPVDAHINIKSGDRKRQFSVLVDRAEGGSALHDGEVELMLHRRLMVDDHYGVSEALDEPGLDGKGLIVRGTHRVLLDTVEDAGRNLRTTAQEMFLSAQPSFSVSGMSAETYVNKFNTKWSGLIQPLPPQVHLLTLERFRHSGPVASPTGGAPFLVRFEHFYEVDDDVTLSKPVSFDIKNLFRGLEFVNATELVLGGNVASSDIHRLAWKTKDGHIDTSVRATPALKGTTVTLRPMQIVTLQINFNV